MDDPTIPLHCPGPPAADRLLVVDDHPINREVLLRQLELLGLAADAAEDGVAALRLWQPGRYAVVLADLHMPRLDGYGLVAAIRSQEQAAHWPRTPIVAVSANVRHGEEDRCLAAGMDAYIAKPVRLADLRSTLRRWVPVSDADPPVRRSGSGVIDRDRLADWMGNDPTAIEAAVRGFLASANDILRGLEADIAAANRAATEAAAHKLKGAAFAVGAAAVAQIAAEIEAAARNGHHGGCVAGVAALRNGLRLVAETITPA